MFVFVLLLCFLGLLLFCSLCCWSGLGVVLVFEPIPLERQHQQKKAFLTATGEAVAIYIYIYI